MPTSVEEATHKQNSQTLLLFPRLSGRKTRCCTHSCHVGRGEIDAGVRGVGDACTVLLEGVHLGGPGAAPMESMAVLIPGCAHDQKNPLVSAMMRKGKGDKGENAQTDSLGIHKLVTFWVQIRKS